MRAYRGDVDETKYISFLIKDDELLEEYKQIWEKVYISIEKEFDSEPVCNERYFIMEKSTQISTIMKYQKKVHNLFSYQEFWSILFLEQVKIIILKCF